MKDIALCPIGTCAGNLNIFQTYSSYLLKLGAGEILLDAGSYRLPRTNLIDFSKLRAIFITHGHNDHTTCLIPTVFRAMRKLRKRPLHLFYPAGWNIFSKVIKVLNFSYPENAISFHAIMPSSAPSLGRIKIGNWSIDITWTRAQHPGLTIGYRFEFREDRGSFSLSYTPDTSFRSKEVVKLSKNVDYWMLDSTFSTQYIDWFVREKETQKRQMGHSSPGYSARMVAEANAQQYLACHFFWKRFSRPIQKSVLSDAHLFCKVPTRVLWDKKPLKLFPKP